VPEQPPDHESLRERTRHIIFEVDSPAANAFDVVLLLFICASVGTVMLDSVQGIHDRFEREILVLEWFFTGVFTIEYGLRVWSARRPVAYVRSFFGIVDLLSVLPSYASLAIGGAQSLMVIRALRLLRIFRVLKLAQFLGEARVLAKAIGASQAKISVFVGSVLVLTVVMGSVMYLVEGPEHGFTSIPRGVYWAIVTLTTVGYGDISPQTALGQFLAASLMIMGYGIIAVPTGIVTVELAEAARLEASTRVCPECTGEGHDRDALFCKYCGHDLPSPAPPPQHLG
jgi:voltage-gated potassium channel